MKLKGHAAVFNSDSLDLGGFVERIRPGAFARTLRDGHSIFMVHHHDLAAVLGSTGGGSLKLSEDSRGLRFEIALPDTSLARDVHTLVKRGDLDKMSFSFRINGSAGEHWEELSDGTILRTLMDLHLFEVSTVALPAYPAASVSARAAAAVVNAQPRRNKLLRRHLEVKLRAVA